MKWKLVSVCLEIVLISKQDRFTVCAEHAIGSEVILGRTRWNSLVTCVYWRLVSVSLEKVLVSMQDRCTVCAKRTIGSEINLDAPDGTPR